MPLFECLSFLISLFSCFWHPWVKRPPLYDNSYSPRSHWPPFYHNMPLGGKLWAKARVCRTIRWGASSKTSEQGQVLCRTESSPKKEHRSGTTRQLIRNSRSDILLRLDPVPRHTVLVWSCLLISWSWISLLFFLFTPLFSLLISHSELYISHVSAISYVSSSCDGKGKDCFWMGLDWSLASVFSFSSTSN